VTTLQFGVRKAKTKKKIKFQIEEQPSLIFCFWFLLKKLNQKNQIPERLIMNQENKNNPKTKDYLYYIPQNFFFSFILNKF